MTFGKRYIAIVGHARPRHENDTPWIVDKLYKTEAEAAIVAGDGKARRCQCDAPHIVRVRVVHVDDTEQTLPSELVHESYERNERVMLAAAAEVERLKSIVGAPVGTKPKPDDSDDDPTWLEALTTVATLARWALNEAGTRRPHQESALRFVESEVKRMQHSAREVQP